MYLSHPKKLASADIVLTTFDALMGDLGHSGENPFVTSRGSNRKAQTVRLRQRKRYRVLPSPLTSILWWRVCLDEAQRVETPTTSSAKMALQLKAKHKWCVSGTPVGRGGLNDLYGLLLFLGVKPFNNKDWFQNCLQFGHQGVLSRVQHLLRDILWRSTKSNQTVRKQMDVPEQVELKVNLFFSSVERHFYQKQLKETILAASTVLSEKGTTKNIKDRDTEMLSLQLHRLRAACCHPQVGSSGICRVIKGGRRRAGRNHDSAAVRYGGRSVASRVLTMDQILDRLIDDARSKCEEAQRVVLLHMNALAGLDRLKVEAKNLGQRLDDNTDASLLMRSAKAYSDALDMANENGKPSTTVGEAVLSGSIGFRSPRKVVRDGAALLDWQMRDKCCNTKEAEDCHLREVWARLDFEGPAKRVSAIQVRYIDSVPQDLEVDSTGEAKWSLLKPKQCVLQVANTSVGGEFIDVHSFLLPIGSAVMGKDTDMFFSGFLATNKSKNWRILVKKFYKPPTDSLPKNNVYIGIEIQLMEPDISSDNLQRLHILHNMSLANFLIQECNNATSEGQRSDENTSGVSNRQTSFIDINKKLAWIEAEVKKRETLHMDHARTLHRESQRQLAEAMKARDRCLFGLVSATNIFEASIGSMVHTHQNWWEDFLSLIRLRGAPSERRSLCHHVFRDIQEFYENYNLQVAKTLDTTRVRSTQFPAFDDTDGLHMALNLRIHHQDGVFSPYARLMGIETVSKLSPFPKDNEIIENSHCHKCRQDWFQTGPKCHHCKLEEILLKSQRQGELIIILGPKSCHCGHTEPHIFIVICQNSVNDPEIMNILKSLANWMKDKTTTLSNNSTGRSGSTADNSALQKESLQLLNARASNFFEFYQQNRKELEAAKLAWRNHFNLLSEVDTLNQCKHTLRLPAKGENISLLTDQELKFIVQPSDISTMYMEHSAKEAMAIASLRQSKDTLRYLKSQSLERKKERLQKQSTKKFPSDLSPRDAETCILCLSPFSGNWAVLSCGHCFHYTPCLEKLMSCSGQNTISCPLRCAVRTCKEDVMIASDQRKDDGSKSKRMIKGCWGTKVDRLVGDVMDVSDLGEKSIIFSQWDDMLSIIEEALKENNVRYVRPKRGKKLGRDIQTFRASKHTKEPSSIICSVLLMNVKNGAEVSLEVLRR